MSTFDDIPDPERERGMVYVPLPLMGERPIDHTAVELILFDADVDPQVHFDTLWDAAHIDTDPVWIQWLLSTLASRATDLNVLYAIVHIHEHLVLFHGDVDLLQAYRTLQVALQHPEMEHHVRETTCELEQLLFRRSLYHDPRPTAQLLASRITLGDRPRRSRPFRRQHAKIRPVRRRRGRR